jgi:hypothetical protein
MRMRDYGWVWEGQGLDPGVYPSIYGIGDGCKYFGLDRAIFLFHPIDRYALEKMADLKEVVCDISETGPGYDRDGLTREVIATPERTRARAELVSRLSLEFPNVTGGYFDDLKGLMKAHNYTVNDLAATRAALNVHNPNLKMWAVVYGHELDDEDYWKSVAPHIDIVSLWVWESANLNLLDEHLRRVDELLPGKPVNIGIYLRDYSIPAPVPVEQLRMQMANILTYLEQERIAGYQILATVTIEGQREQADFLRDFIAAH